MALAALTASDGVRALTVGDTVLASPLSLEDRFEVCTIETDLTAQGAWAVRCQSGTWVVGVRWVKPAPPGSVVAAPVPPAPPPAPAASAAVRAPQAASSVTPPAASPGVAQAAAPLPPAAALVPGPDQRAIPAGLYLAPVGGSLEVLQILGGRVALSPRARLQPEAFTLDNAADVGALKVAGDQMTITWQDRRERTGRYRLDGKCLSWGYLYCRVEPFARGAVLAGRYAGAATAGGGVVSRSVWFEFTPDGRYATERTGAIGGVAGTSGAVAASTAEQGRYRIEGFTLELMPDGGAARSVLAFPYDVYGPQNPIYIEGGFLRRQ